MLFETIRREFANCLGEWSTDVKDEDIIEFSRYIISKYVEKADRCYLYQYRRATYYDLRNIELGCIHLSSNGSFNDIYEGISNFDLSNHTVADLSCLSDMAYISCFSETNDNLLMWSHYADYHKGICVQYDLKRLLAENKELFLHIYPVLYDNQRYIKRNIDSLIDSHCNLHYVINDRIASSSLYEYEGGEPLDDVLPLFLRKSVEWSYEKEWRIVYSLKQLYDSYCYRISQFQTMEFPCISGIYLGCRVESVVKEHIIDICNRNNRKEGIALYEEELITDGFGVHFKKIL